jgi:FMN phosphatase YigB (HAD superfamily)
MVKALVFDAYGTLFDVRSVAGRCEELFPGYGSELTAFWRTKQLEYTWLRSWDELGASGGTVRPRRGTQSKSLNIAITRQCLLEFLHACLGDLGTGQGQLL